MQPQQNVLPDGAQRVQGKSAQEVNILVAKLVAGVVKSTLGPKGMDKLLIDSLGDVTVTNDGVTILREMTIEQPIGKMMVEIAKTQESEVGDGTTTAVVLAGELLAKAESLIKKKIHPTIIAKGYSIASREAIKCLETMATECKDKPMLLSIAKTAMTGKGSEADRDYLANLVVESVIDITNDGKADLEDIQIQTQTGGNIADTEIIRGIVLDKKRVHPNMPKSIKKAKIAIIDAGIEIKAIEFDTKVNITSPEQITSFMNQEASMIKEIMDKVIESGANVLICGRNIEDSAQHFLAKAGIFAVKRVGREFLEKISKATGGDILTDIEDLKTGKLGVAEEVEESLIAGRDLIFIRGCKQAKSLTIFVRGSTEQSIAETKRAMEDAMGDVASAIRTKKAVGGAGAAEIILSRHLKEFAKQYKGREQLAILAFAEAMQIIPETLAENAGLDPIDIMTELEATPTYIGDSPDLAWPGVNVYTGTIMNSWEEGVIEPLQVKTQAVSSAAEVAITVLRIDDNISIMHNPDQKRNQLATQQD